jgi:hypothetical protein
MTSPPRSRHVIEVDPGSDPVTGRVLDRAGRVERELTGWLAIATALQWLLDEGPTDAEQPTPSDVR